MSDQPRPEKLPPSERLARLEALVGQTFALPERALAAITHKSYCNEHRDEPQGDSERLEFLGDAVVDLAIGQRLMERFPHAQEGELTKLRALIVNEGSLSRIARSLRLGDLILLGRGEALTGGREKSSLLADTVEAVLGALYLGNGMAACLELVDRWFEDALRGAAEGRQGKDSKSLLSEATQQRLKLTPRYRVVSETGPEHEKVFEVEVLINGVAYGRSLGRSRKEAEQAAAEKTLAMLEPQP
jgi:ribonuclease-3